MATCTAPRHNSWRAYRKHGCRCPDICRRIRESRQRDNLRRHRPIDVDPIAVELVCMGEYRQLNLLERRAAMDRLMRPGVTDGAIARRLRISRRTVQRYRKARAELTQAA